MVVAPPCPTSTGIQQRVAKSDTYHQQQLLQSRQQLFQRLPVTQLLYTVEVSRKAVIQPTAAISSSRIAGSSAACCCCAAAEPCRGFVLRLQVR